MAQARQPTFYSLGGVPDTVDGRFEMVSLHVFFLLHRLKGEAQDGGATAQALIDLMFANLDQSLRELGAGDLGVAPRIKRMASGFYGRVAAYDAGLKGSLTVLEAALGRNLFGTAQPSAPQLSLMADYVSRAAVGLKGQATALLLAGDVHFETAPLY